MPAQRGRARDPGGACAGQSSRRFRRPEADSPRWGVADRRRRRGPSCRPPCGPARPVVCWTQQTPNTQPRDAARRCGRRPHPASRSATTPPHFPTPPPPDNVRHPHQCERMGVCIRSGRLAPPTCHDSRGGGRGRAFAATIRGGDRRGGPEGAQLHSGGRDQGQKGSGEGSMYSVQRAFATTHPAPFTDTRRWGGFW